MANSSAHRLPDHRLNPHTHHRHHHHHPPLGSAGVAPRDSLSVATLHQHLAASNGARPGAEGPGGQPGSGKAHFKGHQRRQSVARLLPDISKLRLLSWLVEASSELINCDIAIMDGVYAKLNRSRESLLFWDTSNTASLQQSPGRQQPLSHRPPPPPPSTQPVANRIVISQRQHQQRKLSQQQRALQLQAASRNHHSLPITNYDASSLAAVSMSPSLGSQGQQRSATASRAMASKATASDTDSLLSSFRNQQQQSTATGNLDNNKRSGDGQDLQQQQNDLCDNNNEEICDSNQSDEDDDDDNSSAASSSSGIHGGETSLSSTGSGSSSSAASTASGDLATGAQANENKSNSMLANGCGAESNATNHVMSSAELLSEKIRRTVMKHNYLQSLLVNVIRQHDRQRDLMNQQRRRQMSIDQFNLNRIHHQQQQQQRIDLAEIADALDDGCFCLCHSARDNNSNAIATEIPESISCSAGRSSTLPASSLSNRKRSEEGIVVAAGSGNQVPLRKVRRLKKARGSNANELTRQDIINLLADKLCENCFETHYWLHGCSLELMQEPNKANRSQQQEIPLLSNSQDLSASSSLAASNAIIAKRNATFIKLVQQEVRSTISKSIELIDLIRKEIKLPESIKQKQLMRCFSTSIQLLTSVGNYVVPAQDISSFIPEVVGQQETTLFSLPSSDFDHLLLYPSVINPSAPHQHHQLASSSSSATTRNSNYHLAQAPDIPLRRRFNARKQQLLGQSGASSSGCSSTLSDSLSTTSSSTATVPTSTSTTTTSTTTIVTPNQKNQEDNRSEETLSSNLQKLKTSDTKCATLGSTPNATSTTSNANTSSGGGAQVQESSSGASSNNSSASSSIARGAVQQSSLTRAETSSAILDGKTSHSLSFEAIANLSRQQTEDDILYQSRPKFWQSSKFNFIKKLLHVKQQRLLRQQSKDRRIYNNKVQNKFRLVMMDLTHFNKSQQLLTTENGVNSLLTSMRNVLEFGLYLTLKLY